MCQEYLHFVAVFLHWFAVEVKYIKYISLRECLVELVHVTYILRFLLLFHL